MPRSPAPPTRAKRPGGNTWSGWLRNNQRSDMALSTSTLAELVQRRHDCLRELLILVRQQQELAASGDLDRLLAVLSQKQPCLAALESLSRALAPFRDEDAERRVWADPSQRAHCQTLWNECATIYDEIVE